MIKHFQKEKSNKKEEPAKSLDFKRFKKIVKKKTASI